MSMLSSGLNLGTKNIKSAFENVSLYIGIIVYTAAGAKVQGCDRYKYFGSTNQIQNQTRLVPLVLTDTKIQYH